MRGFEKYIAFLLFAFISFWASANTNTDDLVKHAVVQLNKLYTENTYNDVHGKHEDNWYIYILGGTVEELEFIKEETNKSFTPGYLNQLNELLRKVNQGNEVDVYVAFTDYTSELITPIFPPEYNTLSLHELYISQLLENSPDKEQAVQLFRNYKALLNNTIKRIYNESLLSKSNKANVFMPFTSFEKRTQIDNETATITNTIKHYKTYTLYTPKKENFERGEYKKRYEGMVAQYGKIDTEVQIERVVRALNDYYYGEEIDYKECQELLAKPEYQKYLNQDEIWREVIENNPCILYHIEELEGDYIGDTQFAQELRRVVNTMLYGAMAIPASVIVGEYALYEVGKFLIKKYGAEKVRQVSQAAITNIAIQAIMNYYFDENSYSDDKFTRMQKSIENIDGIELSSEVFIAIYNLNMRSELILTCLTAGLEFNEEEWYDASEYDFDLVACRDDVAMQVLLGGVLKVGGPVFSKLLRVVKDNPKMFIQGYREILNDTGDEGLKAFKQYLGEIKGVFDISNGSIISVNLNRLTYKEEFFYDDGWKLGTMVDNQITLLPMEKLYGNQAETFLNSKYYIAQTKENLKTYRRFGGSAKLRGAYVSTKANLTREELALVKEFNNSMRFEAIIEIPKGENIAIGKVGSWPPKSPEYMGGADQLIIDRYNFPENVWVKQVKDYKTGKIY